jgi:hypothetical protein
MSLNLVLFAPAGAVSGWSAGSGLRFTFLANSGANAAIPRIYPATDASYNLTQLPQVYGSTITATNTGAPDGAAYTITWNGIIQAQSPNLLLFASNTSANDTSPTLRLVCSRSGGLNSYIQFQQLS